MTKNYIYFFNLWDKVVFIALISFSNSSLFHFKSHSIAKVRVNISDHMNKNQNIIKRLVLSLNDTIRPRNIKEIVISAFFC